MCGLNTQSSALSPEIVELLGKRRHNVLEVQPVCQGHLREVLEGSAR
jgi:hypothetical protein